MRLKLFCNANDVSKNMNLYTLAYSSYITVMTKYLIRAFFVDFDAFGEMQASGLQPFRLFTLRMLK